MCFSAEASFTAAILLATTGAATLKKAAFKEEIFLAVIPLFFAVQQFSEGLVWLYLTNGEGSRESWIHAGQFYLFFAFGVWPFWIPLALRQIERIPWRRKLLTLFVTGGALLSFFNLFALFQGNISAEIVGHSIQYHVQRLPHQTFLYPLITLTPCFISGLPNAFLYGLIGSISLLIAYYFYTQTVTSVWCFFAALISLFIYTILQRRQKIL